MSYKIIKKASSDYYKDWIQPAVTSATSNGIITASPQFYSGQIWRAADGIVDLNNDTTGFLTTASNAFWQWQLQETIYASNVKLWKDTPHLATQRLYVKLYKDGSLVYTSSEITWGTVNSIDIPLSSEIGFDTIRIEWTYTSDGNGRKFLQELQITAKIRVHEDVYVYKAARETIRRYYKYGTTYTMPNMTSTTTPSGTVSLLSGSLYGSHNSWEMFNSSDANAFIQPNSSSYSVRYIFDSPLQGGEGSVSGYYSQDNPKGSSYRNRTLTSYSIALNYSDGSTEVIKSWSGSTTSVTHIEASYVANKDIVSVDFAFTGGIDVFIFGILYDFTLTHTPILEGTSADYDFYEDVDFYKAVKF